MSTKEEKFDIKNIEKRILGMKVKSFLNEFLLDIGSMKYNYELLDRKLNEKIKEVVGKKDLVDLDLLIKEAVFAPKENRSDKLEELYKTIIDGKKLSDLIKIEVADDYYIRIKNLTDINLLKDNRKMITDIKFYKKNIFINNASHTKSLFTLYETSFVKLMKLSIEKYPDAFLKDEHITYDTLENLKFDKSKVIENFIENKTNCITKESTHLKKVCQELNINYEDFKGILKDFNEIFYRRHILTHDNGELSQEYLDKVDNKFKKLYTKDNMLSFTNDYIEFATNTILKVIFQLFILSIYREEISEEEIYDLEKVIFEDFFKKENWELSKHIYNSLRKKKFDEDLAYNEVFFVNYMCCLKNLGEEKELKKQLKKFDVGSRTHNYKVVKLLLQGEFDKVNNMLERCYSHSKEEDGKISSNQIEEWPVFMGYRDTKFFNEFKGKYKEDFKITEILKDNQESEEE